MEPELYLKNLHDVQPIFSELENNVRQVTKDAMDQVYGSNWEESTKVGFDSLTKTSLHIKKKEFEESSGLKHIAGLVDFADLSLVVEIILQNKILFDKIFSWGNSYDYLTKFAHINQRHDLSNDEKKELFAIYWLVTKQIQDWYAGTETKILWYAVDLSFEFSNNAEPRKSWFNRIKARATDFDEFIQPNLGRVYMLKFENGAIFLTNPISNKINTGGKTIYSERVRVMTQSPQILDYVISMGSHSYWNVSWVIRENNGFRSLMRTRNFIEDDQTLDPDLHNEFSNWGVQNISFMKFPT